MVVSDDKQEYPDFFYLDNTMPGISPEAYDIINRSLSRCGANIRIGPPLDGEGKINIIGLELTCGIYMKKEHLMGYQKRILNLEEAMSELVKLF